MPEKRMTIVDLAEMKAEGEKITSLTAYDATFARVLDSAGIEVLLVGDSLGMVVQGQPTTLPVSVDDMVYHTRAVVRGSRRALVVADMPFLSYTTPEQALEAAGRLMQQGGAHMVKLEGGARRLEVVHRLSEEGLPVCAHLGLLPQSVYKLGGYRVQGRSDEDAGWLLADARALQEAGADLLVLECVPEALAAQVCEALQIPVIGIGAGAACDGQVLVLHDMLGMVPEKAPRFVKDFLAGQQGVAAAVDAYIRDVKAGRFPGPEHSFE
ncbi:MAG TPA: 3-methyl-2-oxobutanoate hydroxymethyltransferase [Chromatiales bacterium]|nr:3-methyl-2-oxobutanoate hydroxymethyltransferase [Chromatiales bacterium]